MPRIIRIPRRIISIVALAGAVASLAGCPELLSALSAAAPAVGVAGQVATSYAAAVASARASGQLPAGDPRVDELEARLRALELAEASEAARCPAPDAGTAPPFDANTVAELLERDAAARLAAADERRALAAEIRALVITPQVSTAARGADVDAGALDAGDGGR